MSMGDWSPLEEQNIPGLYNRFIALARERIRQGPRGYVGIPITADWGPDHVMVDIKDEAKLKDIFGTGGTTYLVKRLLLAGKRFKPTKAVVYRMANASAKAAVATIDGLLELPARYKGKRGDDFSASIIENLVDEGMVDVKIYEKETLLATYTVKNDGIDDLVAAINGDDNRVVNARKLGEGILTEMANLPFTGGDSGSELTTDNYMNALAAFEPVLVNVFVLDGVTDPDILLSTRSWTKRVRKAGKEVMFVQGGSHEEDKDPKVGNQRSYDANYEGVVNVTVGGMRGDTKYNSAEMACQIAGLIAGCPINKSITYKELEDIDDVTVNLSPDQISTALKMGSLVLIKDVDPETDAVSVKVQQGINTLTNYPEGRNRRFSKIRCIRTLDAIDYDTGRWAAKNIIGEIDEGEDGQATLKSGIKLYLETLAGQNAISNDFLVEVDTQFVSEGDTVYLDTKAMPLDSIELIFNTIYV